MNAGGFDGDLQPWTAGQREEFDRAIGLLRALTAAYSARIAQPDVHDDLSQLRAERRRFATQQRQLDPADQTTIAQILAEYPALLGNVRREPP